MKFILIFEEKFNYYATKFAVFIFTVTLNILPKRFLRKLDRIKGSLEETKVGITQKALLIAIEINQKKNQEISKIKELHLKEKAEKLAQNIKENTPKNKAQIQNSFRIFSEKANQLLKKLKKISPQKIALAIIFVILSTLSITAVITQGNRLADRIYSSEEGIEVEDNLPKRKEYYKNTSKQVILTNITLPVHFVNINEIRKTDIELTAITNNRFTKKYIEQFEYKIRDHLFMTVEPVVPEFPLKEEGKDIIKEKVKNEINQYLLNQKIDGKIESIHVNYILSI